MSIASLIEALFKLHINAKNSGKSFYYKNIISVLSHPLIKKVLNPDALIEQILKINFIYINRSIFANLSEKLSVKTELIDFLFDDWGNDAKCCS